MNKIYSILVIILVSVLSVNFASAQTKEEVMALVKQTRADIENDAGVTLRNVNAGKHPYRDSKNSSLYVFILDSDLNVAAHAIKPHTVGKNLKGKPDVKGKMFRDVMQRMAMENGKGWIDYYYLNPKTNQVSHKESYFELAAGSDGKKYIVGSGKYVDK